eukprot:m.120232 g.120232  ORF g.120232 m.120232 type:complete len:73 (+) comp12916_c0_seq31:1114-1332(+)
MCFLRVDVGGERVLKYAKDLLRVKFPQLSDDLSSPTVNVCLCGCMVVCVVLRVRLYILYVRVFGCVFGFVYG